MSTSTPTASTASTSTASSLDQASAPSVSPTRGRSPDPSRWTTSRETLPTKIAPLLSVPAVVAGRMRVFGGGRGVRGGAEHRSGSGAYGYPAIAPPAGSNAERGSHGGSR